MTIEQRLARLEAEADIRRLKARYLNACDAKQADVVRACFTDDAVIDFEGMGVFNVDQLVGIFTEIAVNSPIADSHHGHNAEIDILSADTAKAVWNLCFTTYDPRTGQFRALSMFYHDEYRRTADGWRMSKTRSLARSALEGTAVEGRLSANWLLPTL